MPEGSGPSPRASRGPRTTDGRPAAGLPGRDLGAGELGNLVAACLHAAEHGPRRLASRLAGALGGYLWNRFDLAMHALAIAVAIGGSRPLRIARFPALRRTQNDAGAPVPGRVT